MATPVYLRSQAEIRSYAIEELWPRIPHFYYFHDRVGKEDVVTVLELLLVTQLYSPEMNRIRRNRGLGFEVKAVSARKRITSLRLGKSWRSNGGSFNWNFHTERVFDLLLKLDCLRELELCYCQSFRLLETISRYPNLNTLSVDCRDPSQMSIGSLELLQEIKYSNLECIKIEDGCSLIHSEKDLATFLFDIFPALPKLRNFHVSNNRVESIQGIAERIRNNRSNESLLAAKSRLRRLSLGYRANSVLKFKDPNEVGALKTILNAYRELNHIDGLFCSKSTGYECEIYDASIIYQMELNFAGRILIESRGNQGTAAPPIHFDIPLSVWPTILARKYKRPFQSGNADGIYYLLRNVQSLHQRNNRNPSGGIQ